MKNNKFLQFSILGNNVAGLKAKVDSLNHLIRTLNYPSCITIQETKLPRKKMIKLEGYETFEKIRTDGGGGGLFTAIDINLNPVEVEASGSTSDILVVQCNIDNVKVRVINAYGPQEYDTLVNRISSWQGLNQEVKASKNNDCLTVFN